MDGRNIFEPVCCVEAGFVMPTVGKGLVSKIVENPATGEDEILLLTMGSQDEVY